MSRKDWKNVLYLLHDIFKQDKRRVFCMVMKAIIEVINPYITILLLGSLTDAIVEGKDFYTIVIYILMATTVKVIFTIVNARVEEWFNQKLDYTKDIEERGMNEKAMSLDYELIENVEVENLRFQSISKSFYGIAGWCLLNVKHLIEGILSIVITIGIIIPLIIESDSSLGFIGSMWSAIGLVVLIIGVTLLNYKSGIYYTQEAKKILDKLNNCYNRRQFYLDKFANVEFQKDVRINNWEKLIDKDINDLFQRIKRNEYHHGNMYSKRQMVSGIISTANSFLIYMFSGLRAYMGMITVGNVITYSSSIIQFSRKMKTFAETLGNMKSVVLYAQDYHEFMTLEKRRYVGKLPMPKSDKIYIEFEHVSFKYPGEENYVLKDICLAFWLDKKIAIVGRNGSGKTTFVKLLCRLYEVSEGSIKINGVDIKEYDLKAYWEWFSIVFQDFSILGFSVAENVAGESLFNTSKVLESLGRAGIKEATNIASKKVGKVVYEEGINFSGGEKQKIAIARAIYKDSNIVIMDEPTSALDPISESEVYEGFDELVNNKPALYISHRLSSCKFCEDIIVFDSGNVVQRGNHVELCETPGLYKNLWEAQAECYLIN